MSRAIEKLMLHPAQYIEKAECDITRFIMVSPALGGLEERKPKGDYSTVSVSLIVPHTAGKTTMHTISQEFPAASCANMRSVSRCNQNRAAILRIHRRKTKHVPEGSPQTCRAKDVGGVSCVLALGKAVEGSVEVLGNKVSPGDWRRCAGPNRSP